MHHGHIAKGHKHIGHLNYIDMENIIGGMTGVGEWRNA